MSPESPIYFSAESTAQAKAFVASAIVGLSAIQRLGVEITDNLEKSSLATEFFDNEKEALDLAAEEYRKFSNRSA
jgi:hypothetical protein